MAVPVVWGARTRRLLLAVPLVVAIVVGGVRAAAAGAIEMLMELAIKCVHHSRTSLKKAPLPLHMGRLQLGTTHQLGRCRTALRGNPAEVWRRRAATQGSRTARTHTLGGMARCM